MRYTLTTHNTNFGLGERGVYADLNNNPGEIRGLQEVSDEDNQAAVERFCRDYSYGNTGTYPVPIIWDRSVFTQQGMYKQVSIAAPVDSSMDPMRYATILRLRHLITGRSVSVINTHGHKFTQPGLDNKERRFEIVEDQFIRLAALLTHEMARPDTDSVHLVGDLNVTPLYPGEDWWLPSKLLAPFGNIHSPLKSIDWLLQSKNSKAEFVKFGMNNETKTDHAIKWAVYRF